MMEYVVKPVSSVGLSSLLHFYWSEMSFLDQKQCCWNTVMVNKAFCESTDGGPGGIISRGGIYTQNVCLLQ